MTPHHNISQKINYFGYSVKRTVVVLTKKYKTFCFFCLQMTSRKKAKSEPNPWAMESIYYYQFYCCPECDLRLALKQDFVDHAYECHLEARSYFPNIVDGSLEDVILPWDIDSANLPNKTPKNNSRKRKSQDERLSKTNSSFTKKQREGNEFEDLVKKELCSEDLETPFSVKMDVESLDKLEPDSEGEFKCPLCVAKFTSKNLLSDHFTNHKFCPKCGKTFGADSNANKSFLRHLKNCKKNEVDISDIEEEESGVKNESQQDFEQQYESYTDLKQNDKKIDETLESDPSANQTELNSNSEIKME